MASKPRRRRHNKHNLSILLFPTSKGGVERVPKSRKAFKSIMRDDRNYATHDFAIIKKALYGIKLGEVVFVAAEKAGEYELNNKQLAGYYSVNAKGPVRMTDELMDKYRKFKAAQKESKAKMQEEAYAG